MTRTDLPTEEATPCAMLEFCLHPPHVRVHSERNLNGRVYVPREHFYSRGERIGSYEIVSMLSVGEMGIVYEARPVPELRPDLVSAGISRVALKMARLDLIPTSHQRRRVIRTRLEREFELLRAMTSKGHPNVVSVYDFGWESDIPYYVMEWVDGITFGEILEESPPLEQVLLMVAKLCSALAFLHEGGVCHRDVRISNVLIREDDEPVLIDFGISLPYPGRTLTFPQELMGMPWYASPEYAAHLLKSGQRHTYVAEPTDDMWALGVMLYLIVTGRLPWLTPSGNRESLLEEIRTRPVRHPSKGNPRVPAPLGDAVMQLLQKKPHRRVQNGRKGLMCVVEACAESQGLGKVPASASGYVNFEPRDWPRLVIPLPESRWKRPVTLATLGWLSFFGVAACCIYMLGKF